MKYEQNSSLTYRQAMEELIEIYDNRDEAARKWESEGGKIIGCLGSDVPEEIIIAAGYIPYQICGTPGKETPNADKYLELAFEPRVKSQFEKIADGTYRFIDRLIISNSSDVLVRLFYYMRQINLAEPEVQLPPIYFFDIKFSKFRSSTLYNRDRIRELIDAAGKWSGRSITQESLQQAISLCGRNRELLSEMNRYRISDPVRISGTQAIKMIGASLFMPKEEHCRLMEVFLSGADNLPEISKKRIFLSGSMHDNTQFYELVESCGAVIVGEDHDMGNRIFMGPEMDASEPVASITDFYHLRFPASKKSLVSERVSLLVDQVKKTKAQAVIFYINKFDDAASWDYTEQMKAVKDIGVPVLLLRDQPYVMKGNEELREIIGRFIESVGADGKEDGK